MIPARIRRMFLSWRHNSMMTTFNKNPQKLAIKGYKSIYKIKPNLIEPKNLLEKIIWLQFNSDTSLWTKCADKLRVREYVKEKGLEDILYKLYGMWENSNDIDFSKLPDKFVLKTNNSCGQIIIVKDKTKLDIAKVRSQLNEWMRTGYGYANAQMHYTRIKPCIIAEEYIEVPEGETLTDYKIWSFRGKPECILVCSNRVVNKGNYNLSMFDTSWNNISNIALDPKSKHYNGEMVEKPKNLERMLEIAQILSLDFPEVRVDLYNINGRILFGELTFTTGYGSYLPSFYEYLGSKVDLNNL